MTYRCNTLNTNSRPSGTNVSLHLYIISHNVLCNNDVFFPPASALEDNFICTVPVVVDPLRLDPPRCSVVLIVIMDSQKI